MHALYSLLLGLLQPLLKRKLRRRGLQESGYLEHMEERWGEYAHDSAEEMSSLRHRPMLWVHAVSLGETRAAAVLLHELRSALPHMRLLLTHGTATGRAEGKALLQEGDHQAWLPWDTPTAVDRFLRYFQPTLGILIETEVWPNVVVACKARGVPLLLVNARLSEKSFNAARRMGWLAKPAYRALTAVYAQTPADAQRLTALGAPVGGVFGNLKFDAKPDPGLLAMGRQWRNTWAASLASPKPVVMFASSREGEEALLLKVLASIPVADATAVQWLLVPRHPQRFEEVAKLVQSAGLSLQRRSQWGSTGPCGEGGAGHAATPDVWLGDSLGEMPVYFALADVALLGGSFMPLGGQNLIEAAACGCPVIMGPHTFNFAEAADNSAQAGAAVRASDIADGVRMALEMLQKPERLSHARHAAAAFLNQHQGATQKTLAAVQAWIR